MSRKIELYSDEDNERKVNFIKLGISKGWSQERIAEEFNKLHPEADWTKHGVAYTAKKYKLGVAGQVPLDKLPDVQPSHPVRRSERQVTPGQAKEQGQAKRRRRGPIRRPGDAGYVPPKHPRKR